MDPAIQPAVRKKLEADHNCTPVFLTQEVRQSSVCCKYCERAGAVSIRCAGFIVTV